MAQAVPMMIASVAVSAVQGIAQARMAAQNASAGQRAAHDDSVAEMGELTRLQDENNRVANEQKSDRIRQAEAELARARSAAAEGFGMLHREVAELGYLEGVDLSRIESNRASQNTALQTRKEQSARSAGYQIEAATRSVKNANTAAFLNTIGSGVQIAAQQQAYDRAVERAKNQRNP